MKMKIKVKGKPKDLQYRNRESSDPQQLISFKKIGDILEKLPNPLYLIDFFSLEIF